MTNAAKTGYYDGCTSLDTEMDLEMFVEIMYITHFRFVKPGSDFWYNGDLWTKMDMCHARNPARSSRSYLDPSQRVTDTKSSAAIKNNPIATLLEEVFGAEETFGLHFVLDKDPNTKWPAKEYDEAIACGILSVEDEAVSYLYNGGSGACCTEYARIILDKLGADRVKIYGFHNKDNPLAGIVKMQLHPGGHDFAVVDDRYIVDPWPRLVKDAFARSVFDMQDDNDQHVVESLYGTKACWKRMLESEK